MIKCQEVIECLLLVNEELRRIEWEMGPLTGEQLQDWLGQIEPHLGDSVLRGPPLDQGLETLIRNRMVDPRLIVFGIRCFSKAHRNAVQLFLEGRYVPRVNELSEQLEQWFPILSKVGDLMSVAALERVIFGSHIMNCGIFRLDALQGLRLHAYEGIAQVLERGATDEDHLVSDFCRLALTTDGRLSTNYDLISMVFRLNVDYLKTK